MKKIICSVLILSLVLVSCNQKNNEGTVNNTHMMDNNSTMMQNDSTMMKNDSTMINTNSPMMHNKIYSCPMHPEVHGNLNAKCSKCGMKLTVLVPDPTEKK